MTDDPMKNCDNYFTDDYETDDDGVKFGVTKDDLANAIGVFVLVHDPATIVEVLRVFRISREFLFEVIDSHPYLFIFGDVIEMDGF